MLVEVKKWNQMIVQRTTLRPYRFRHVGACFCYICICICITISDGREQPASKKKQTAAQFNCTTAASEIHQSQKENRSASLLLFTPSSRRDDQLLETQEAECEQLHPRLKLPPFSLHFHNINSNWLLIVSKMIDCQGLKYHSCVKAKKKYFKKALVWVQLKKNTK